MLKITAKEILIYCRANNTENTRYVVTFSWPKAEGENFLDKGCFHIGFQKCFYVFTKLHAFTFSGARRSFSKLNVRCSTL